MSSGPAHPGVLVGVDGSPSSRVAVRWAAHEATVRNIPLTPVHVVSTPAVNSSALSWPAVPIPAELRQWQEDEAAKVMADAIKLVEDSAAEGARPEIKSELFFLRPCRHLSICPRRPRWWWSGAGAAARCVAACSVRSAPG